MAGIGEIRPQVPVWQPGEPRAVNPAGNKRQQQKRQPNKEESGKHDKDEPNDPFHIDEYA
jgi:hypothetical protein